MELSEAKCKLAGMVRDTDLKPKDRIAAARLLGDWNGWNAPVKTQDVTDRKAGEVIAAMTDSELLDYARSRSSARN